jgi:hypothetical protein
LRYPQPADEGLSAAGALQVGAPRPDAHGFLRRDKQFPTSFVHDDGARHFMWGTTYYHLLLNARAGDRWKAAIDGAGRYGMNKVRFSLSPSGDGERSGDYPSTRPFVDKELRRLDLAHWRTADRVIDYMNSHGMLADVVFFWRMSEKAVSAEKRKADERFLRYAIARYAAYPNVIWCMVNEWNYSSVPRDYWNHLGRLVRAEDPWSRSGNLLRVHSIHQQTRPDWNFTDQDWPSHAILQLGVRNRGTSARIGDEWANAGKAGTRFRHGDEWGNHSIVRNWTGKYPIVNDEYGYIGEPQDDSEPKNADGSYKSMTREKHRHAMWGIAVGGGYGAAGDKNQYGANGRPYFSANWHDAPEYGDVRRLVDFFTKGDVEYWKMAPHNELVKGDRVYALAEPGRQYVIYAAAGGPCTAILAAGTDAAVRFDPGTGKKENLAEVPGGQQVFQLPQDRDTVLLLRAKPAAPKQRQGSEAR